MKHLQPATVTSHLIADDGSIPNNPTLPMLLYTSAIAFGADDPAVVCERIFAANGWGQSWRNGIYDFHHFHSNAHEVLAIARGSAQVHLGGEQGLVTTVNAGDVILLPAGFGHKNLGSSPDLLVIGAYPSASESWDLCRGLPEERPRVLENIAAVELPKRDPLCGADGPLFEHWFA